MAIRRAQILVGDVRERLRELADGSVQCCVTSPPYWGLRDYGHAGQLGLERAPEEYVANMVDVFREVRRVLRDDGTLWLNLGDSYAGSWGAQSRGDDYAGNLEGGSMLSARQILAHPNRTRTGSIPDGSGLKPKDLVGIPWRVAFALQADGWWLRSDVIWSKPNPMPESVTDRPTKAHEYLFLMSKSERYFYDADAIAERAAIGAHVFNGGHAGNDDRQDNGRQDSTEATSRNRRTVWTIATQPFAGAHFAVMPQALVEPCVLAGSSEKGACEKCGAPWERRMETEAWNDRDELRGMARGERPIPRGTSQRIHNSNGQTSGSIRTTTGWAPSCACSAPHRPCLVLDPFTGSGTVGVVALKHGRSFVGTELNPKYAAMAQARIDGDAPLFNATSVEKDEAA